GSFTIGRMPPDSDPGKLVGMWDGSFHSTMTMMDSDITLELMFTPSDRIGPLTGMMFVDQMLPDGNMITFAFDVFVFASSKSNGFVILGLAAPPDPEMPMPNLSFLATGGLTSPPEPDMPPSATGMVEIMGDFMDMGSFMVMFEPNTPPPDPDSTPR